MKNIVILLFAAFTFSQRSLCQAKTSSQSSSTNKTTGLGIVFADPYDSFSQNPSLLDSNSIKLDYGLGTNTEYGGAVTVSRGSYGVGVDSRKQNALNLLSFGSTVELGSIRIGASAFDFVGRRWNANASLLWDIENFRTTLVLRRVRDQGERIDFGLGYRTPNWIFDAAAKKAAPINTSPLMSEVGFGYKHTRFTVYASYYMATELQADASGFSAKLNYALSQKFNMTVQYKPYPQEVQKPDYNFLVDYRF